MVHSAVRHAAAEVVQQILEAVPAAATAADQHGCLPIHHAAQAEGDHADVVQLLLAAASDTATAVDRDGYTPLHFAASQGNSAVVQNLLAAAPGTATAVDSRGATPLLLAAFKGHATVVRQLLAAAPETAEAEAEDGITPLALAARQGHLEVAELILEAAPSAWATGKLVPLKAALPRGHLEIARRIIATEHQEALAGKCDGKDALELLGSLPPHPAADVLPLWHDVVSGPPLLPEDWELVPAPCPGLGRALPAVLAGSEEEAGLLVARLPLQQRLRLRALALGMAHASRHTLPAAVNAKILALAAAVMAADALPAAAPK